MPPRPRIDRQMILDAAFSIVRESGHEALNVRAVAQRLGCSTQPVMYCFATMDELRAETYRMADAYHTAYIMPKGGGEADPLTELGLNYVRFGYEEKNLFRFLFQTDSFSGMNVEALLSDPALEGIFGIVAGQTGCGASEVKEVFFGLFVAAHGCASLLCNNAMAYEEEVIRRVLTNAWLYLEKGRDEG